MITIRWGVCPPEVRAADAAVFARAMAGRSMAEAQGVLLEHKRDPAAAIAAVRDMHRRVG